MSSKAWLLAHVAFALLTLFNLCTGEAFIAPIVVQPSQYWEGSDGQWSTFSLRVGTNSSKQQVVRLLPSTAIPNTWVVWSDACRGDQQCEDKRGGVFHTNYSSSWTETGTFNLWFESNLNYSGDGLYGQERLGLGLEDKNGVTLDNQVVAAFFNDSFYLGYFGLNPQPTNFSDFNNPVPSYLQTLRTLAKIPSLAYGYTAGNRYHNSDFLGSLTLGGYDASRFIPNPMTFSMAPDSTRDLVVWIQSISANDKDRTYPPMAQTGIKAYVDSTVPWLVLPDDVCDAFEAQLGLTYDNATKLYLISDSQHSALTNKGINITFTLGTSKSGGANTNIVLPYDAFELMASAPLVRTPSRYFPLRRGSNDTQWTLGRTFLQEAYLIADYEHFNFSLSQCDFSAAGQTSIQVIHDKSYVPPTDPTGGSGTGAGHLATGAIVGIAIAGALIILIIAALAIARRKRKWPFHKLPRSGAHELDSDSVGHEADGRAIGGKAPFPTNAYEADSKRHFVGQELQGSDGIVKSELAGSEGRRHKSELADPNLAGVYRPEHRGELFGSDGANEVEGSHVFMELAGSPVPEYYGSSKAVQMAPLSPHSDAISPGLSPHRRERSPLLSPQSAASPVSHQSSRRGRGSATAAESYHSPVSPDSQSREPSRARARVRDGSRGNSISPGGFEDKPLPDPHEDISRSVSRSRPRSRDNFI